MDLNMYLKSITSKGDSVDLFNLISEADKEENRIISEISSKIISRRKELGLSQAQLANILEVKQSMISQWESGNCNFTVETIAKILDALDIKLELSFIDKYSGRNTSVYSNAHGFIDINIMEAA